MIRKGGRTYTDEEFLEAVKKSFSISEVLKKLNLNPSGANYRGFKIIKKRLNCSTDHFTGQAWLRGKTHSIKNSRTKSLDEILVEHSDFSSTGSLKRKLLKCGLLIYECSDCKISTWRNKSLVLQLDHINGVNDDHRLENLRLLCPNCHSQTETFAGKNKGIKNG